MAKIGYKKDATDFCLKDEQGNAYLTASRFSYAILEKIDAIKFEEFGKRTDYINWDKGWLFGDGVELKWLKRNGKFHLVVITDEDVLPQGFHEFSCENLRPIYYEYDEGNPIERSVFLWGEKDRTINSWFEARIPKKLVYPSVNFKAPETRVKMVVREYEFEETLPETQERITSKLYRFIRLIQDR